MLPTRIGFAPAGAAIALCSRREERVMSNRRADGGLIHDASDTAADGARMARSEAKIRDAEIYRMAAFRVRESANRIAVLGYGAEDPDLRRELAAVCERLLDEERALLELAGTA
jgi:hypothetical protein